MVWLRERIFIIPKARKYLEATEEPRTEKQKEIDWIWPRYLKKEEEKQGQQSE